MAVPAGKMKLKATTHPMNRAILICWFSAIAFASGGDTPLYPFTLGEWEFELSSVGDGRGNVVSALSATNPKRKVSAEALLDHRWYVLAATQFDRGPKAAKPFCEALVGFAGTEWRALPGSSDVVAAMRESPPTLAYKQNFEFLTMKPK
jgi:hypothetical protein